MIVIGEIALKALMTEIVNGTHSLTDTAGNAVATSTIAESQLRMAALCALQIATGEAIWPGDRPIRIKQARPVGPYVEVENVA